TDFHFLWHIFSSTVKWLFIMNFVSSHQIFSVAMQQSPLGSSLYYLVEIKSSGSQCQLLS
ncbi:MAG: hypothetical protein ACEY3L_16810, partial [Wolbachia sp.]